MELFPANGNTHKHIKTNLKIFLNDYFLQNCFLKRLHIMLLLMLLLLLLLLLSHISHVRPCATPEMAAHQAPPVPGILQARTLEWVAISFSNA